MADAPKKRSGFWLFGQLGFVLVILMLLMVMVTAPAGAFVYYKTNDQPGIDTTKLYRPGNAKCWPAGASPYVAFFNAAAAQSKVNVHLLVAIANRESSFNPKATSHDPKTGQPIAYGLMQVTPDKISDKSKLYDPETNIKAGAGYLATILRNNQANLLNPTDDQVRLAVSMYNAGPGAPQKADKKYVSLVLKDYQGYVRCAIQAGDTTGGAPITGAGAHVLANWVNDPTNTAGACQKTSPAGNNCSSTVKYALEQAFHLSPGSGGVGPPLRTANEAELAQGPADVDIQEAQQILAAGDIPIWHVVGDASGQHWIAILGISGSAVTFYDPATGTVRTDKQLTDQSDRATKESYFGITAEQPQGLQRGYRFSPPKTVANP